MSDEQLTPEINDAFSAPEANLANVSEEKPILQFERFSAWWVLLLSVITFGIYPVYWLYTRTSKVSELVTENKVSSFRLNAFLVLVIAYWVIAFAGGFIGEEAGTLFTALSGLVTIGYLVFYVLIAFGARRALREIINSGSEDFTPLKGISSGLGTFFAPAIYLQYKANEAIDKQS